MAAYATCNLQLNFGHFYPPQKYIPAKRPFGLGKTPFMIFVHDWSKLSDVLTDVVTPALLNNCSLISIRYEDMIFKKLKLQSSHYLSLEIGTLSWCEFVKDYTWWDFRM